MVWRIALLLHTAVIAHCCPGYAELEANSTDTNSTNITDNTDTSTTNSKGLRPPHGEDLNFDPNATTLFPKRFTKRTKKPYPIDGPGPNDPKWNEGWGVPEGQQTPWGGGGTNAPLDDDDDGKFDPAYPNGYYYDKYGNKVAADPDQDYYIDADGNRKPVKGKKDKYPHGYYYDADGNKVAAGADQDYYYDEFDNRIPVRGKKDKYPHGFYLDKDGNKVAAKEGQDYYYDEQGNKKPVQRDYYPDGYYYDKDGNKVPAKPGQTHYYDENGIKKPIIQDHGYYFDKDGKRVPAKPGQTHYYDAKGNKKPIRGKPPAKENPNPWSEDSRLPESWKGLGAGFGGAPPPPWAYVPANYGKPSYCFLPPIKGHCQESLTRYAYNPFSDDCSEFPYSGCGGNGNNFLTQERCETECTKLPEPDCDPLAYDSVNLGNYMDVGRRCA